MKKFICALLATLACLTLFACAPSNVEKAKTKIKSLLKNLNPEFFLMEKITQTEREKMQPLDGPVHGPE